MSAPTRACDACGQPFATTTARPRKRFCSPRCKAAWHRRNNRTRQHGARPAADTYAYAPYAANDADAYAEAIRPPNGGPGTGRCPHCAMPVAAITLLVDPAAAHVPTPELHPGGDGHG